MKNSNYEKLKNKIREINKLKGPLPLIELSRLNHLLYLDLTREKAIEFWAISERMYKKLKDIPEEYKKFRKYKTCYLKDDKIIEIDINNNQKIITDYNILLEDNYIIFKADNEKWETNHLLNHEQLLKHNWRKVCCYWPFWFIKEWKIKVEELNFSWKKKICIYICNNICGGSASPKEENFWYKYRQFVSISDNRYDYEKNHGLLHTFSCDRIYLI